MQRHKSFTTDLGVLFALLTPFLSGIVFFNDYFNLSHVSLVLGFFILFMGGYLKSIDISVFYFYLIIFLLLIAYSFISPLSTISADRIVNILIGAAKLSAILFMALCYIAAYNACGKNIGGLFFRYCELAKIFCFIGIFQFLIFFVAGLNIPDALNLSYKQYDGFIGIPGLSVEPAFYACAILPYTCFYVSKSIKEGFISKNALIGVLAILFSTSSLGLLGILFSFVISLFLYYRKLKNIIFVSPFIIIGLYYGLTSDFFMTRLLDTYNSLFSPGFYSGASFNLSTYSIITNFKIGLDSIGDSFGGGTGFGQYYQAYDAFIGFYNNLTYRDFVPGRGSATSFFIRFVVENGLLGLLLIIFFSLKNIKLKGNNEIEMINMAMTSVFFVILIRMGEYYHNGVVLFIIMLYLSSKEISIRNKKSF